MPSIPSAIEWTPSYALRALDQTRLPREERWLELDSVVAVTEAIRGLVVRGAPLIGIAAAMGVVQALREPGLSRADALRRVTEACRALGAARPTAVNLAWALDRMRRRAEATAGDGAAIRAALIDEATTIREEDRAMCAAIGRLGAPLLPAGGVVVTICNAGALATGGMGTALAPIYTAAAAGRALEVLVPETRPLLQGSRLTAWELARAGIRCTVLPDSAVATRLRRGDVGCVVVGADRIAANGDVANKIGTYALALAARAHGVPFYVAAPRSTVDLATPSGAAIPIEERAGAELGVWSADLPLAGQVAVWNPAFDVTPAELVTAIVTDVGIVPPSAVRAVLDPAAPVHS